MKVSDIIKIMDINTEVFVFEDVLRCENEGIAAGCDYECNDCYLSCFLPNENKLFRGSSCDCPIRIADLKVVKIDNKSREIQGRRKKDVKLSSVIGISVKRD